MPSQQVVKTRPWRKTFEATRSIRSTSRKSSSRSTSAAGTPRDLRRQRLGSVSSTTTSRPLASDPSSREQTPSLPAYSPNVARPRSEVPAAITSSSPQPETDVEIQSREEDDWVHEVVMAIDMRNRDTVGCCYYVAAEEKMHLLNDVMHGGVDVFATLKDTLEPTTILVSARIDEIVDDVLDPEGAQANTSSNDDRLRLPYHIEVIKVREFDYEDGKCRLAQLHLAYDHLVDITFATPGDDDPFESYNAGLNPGFSAASGRLLRLSTFIDLDSRLSIGCASAVLNYLQSRRAQILLPADDRAASLFRVSFIEMFNIHNVMYLNPDTLASLQILESESHPHAQNQGPNSTGAKESLSVYGLFHHLARSPQGKQRLRAMFLRPSLDTELIQERHRAIATFLRTANTDLVYEMVTALKSIKNMRPVMVHLRKGVSGNADRSQAFKCSVWTTIRAFAFHTLGVQAAARQLQCDEPLTIVTKILETFEPQPIALVGRDIENVVDFRQSQEESRTVINEGVDEALDATRRTYAGIEHLLSQVSEEVIRDYDENSEAAVINVVTYPQIGFLISVHKDEQSGRFPAPPPTHPNQPAWERIFTSEHSTYYKDGRMRALDQRFGDILGNIHDREIELAFELGQRILEREDIFCKISDICGELDALLALAQGANTYKLSQPEMVQENVVDIRGGRHLLQEQLSSNFIANDTFIVGGNGDEESFASTSARMSDDTSLSDDDTSMVERRSPGEPPPPKTIMLTGPNYSGKSVYLKQIALIVFLAHVGSFVPAQRARIGITDKILTRVSTRETVSRQHSAFMIDLQQISSAISLSTPRSLLIIDEFGKGTESADGAGLACAVFEHFLGLAHMQPKILAATHFHEIFEHGFLTTSPGLSFFHMEVRLDQTSDLDQQVTYLYELKEGRSVASFGTVCAAMNGIDAAIVKRATDIIVLQARGDLFAPHEDLSERDRSNLAQAEELGRRFLMQEFGPTHGAPQMDPRRFLAELDF